ncbi:MAG: hypothetical protein A2289_12950 [Deltaproteobacteria bacterium RIFOXYA12_FULL_58_15]|nr:MAG: hypothetical protein A2289_12950 [Deltaproteobacteria bacterium RIFOXYA12_FULL_58_15]OGR10160.1 MAG: hypothetical protein A2341_06215 [Deltaproteobacteria bacterium RIFOXYB12_FULL_58_9]
MSGRLNPIGRPESERERETAHNHARCEGAFVRGMCSVRARENLNENWAREQNHFSITGQRS